MSIRSEAVVIVVCCASLILIGLMGISRGILGADMFSVPLAQASLEILEVDIDSEEVVEDPACIEESCFTDEIRTGYHAVSAIGE